MPKVFKIGRFTVFFWSNEEGEPVHVHVSEGRPKEHATKFWLTSDGGAILANNGSKLSKRDLLDIGETIQANADIVVKEWEKHFRCLDFIDKSDLGHENKL